MSDEHEQNTRKDGGAFKPEFLASKPAFLPEPAPSDDPAAPQAGAPPDDSAAVIAAGSGPPVSLEFVGRPDESAALEDLPEPSPDLPAMHMALQERIVACLKGFIATVPQAGGMAPMVAMLERDFHRLRDLVTPPPAPPEPEGPQQDHS